MENSLTQVYNTFEFIKYRLASKCENLERNVYYDGFLTDSNESISPGDWCIITNPYDGEEYTEKCKNVALENNDEIFYGMEGTRCLVIDAIKIVGTTDDSLKKVNQIIITEEMLKEFNNNPLSFMEEDL